MPHVVSPRFAQAGDQTLKGSENPAPRTASRTVATYFTRAQSPWRSDYTETGFHAWPFHERARNALAWLERIRPNGRPRLLELGCGSGVQAVRASRAGWHVVAMDLAHNVLRDVPRAEAGPRWLAGTIEQLPLRRCQFDAIVMLGVLGYVNDPGATLAELRRYLRPGGYLIVSFATKHELLNSISRRIGALPRRIYQWLRGRNGAPRREPIQGLESIYQFWERVEFHRLLETHGYVIRDEHAFNYGRIAFSQRQLWPARIDIALSCFIGRCARVWPFRRLQNIARTHIALAERAR